MKEGADTDPRLARLISQGVGSVEVWGDSFGSSGSFDDGLPRYRSSHPEVGEGFLRFLRTVKSDTLSVGLIPDHLFVQGRAGLKWQVELYPGRPEMSGAAFVAALRLLSDDLVVQTARRVRPVASRVRWVEIGTGVISFPTFHVRQPDRVRSVVASLSRLDHRAFVFGESGFAVYVTLHLSGNRREILRLRPQSFPDAEAAHLKNPPLPLPLWQEIFLPDRKRMIGATKRTK